METTCAISRGKDKDVVCILTMNYYSAVKKNEIFPSVTTWMDLESIIPSEHTHIQSEHTEKDKYCMISLIRGI